MLCPISVSSFPLSKLDKRLDKELQKERSLSEIATVADNLGGCAFFERMPYRPIERARSAQIIEGFRRTMAHDHEKNGLSSTWGWVFAMLQR